MSDRSEPLEKPTAVSRRVFIGSGALLGGLALVGCRPDSFEQPVHPHPSPAQSAGASGYEFFTSSELESVDAIIARIMPGDEQDPGAREAGVAAYIDAKLASFQSYAEPTYIQGPFVEVIQGGSDDAAAAQDGSLAVTEDQLYRYGYQSGIPPQEVYRTGLPALDRFTESRFGAPFAQLSEEDQDAALQVLDGIQQRSEGGSTADQGGENMQGGGQEENQGGGEGEDARAAEEAFGELDPGNFFTTVRTDTIEGMFADPLYGGNQGLVGWTMIGYPGPQRAYSPEEMLAGTRRGMQSLDDMPHMNPDRQGDPDEARDALEQPRSGVRDG